jgi:hypothetical protein
LERIREASEKKIQRIMQRLFRAQRDRAIETVREQLQLLGIED